MRNSTFSRTMAGTVSALALTIAFSASAMAAQKTVGTPCTAAQTAGGMETVYTQANNGGLNTYSGDAYAHCVNTYNVGGGSNVTGKITWEEVKDKNGKPIVVDGHTLVQVKNYHEGNPQSEVHGINGIAIGNGANVGSWTPPACSNGEKPIILSGPNQLGDTSCPSYKASLDEQKAKKCDKGDYNAKNLTCDGALTPGLAKDVAYGTAVGANTSVQADNGTAVGAGAKVEAGATNGTAIGTGAVVKEGHTNSTAIGAGATTDRANQVKIGTADQTITAPGIYGDNARAQQDKGSLELVTTDKYGNLASDGGKTNALIAAHSAAIAGLKGDVRTLYKLNAMAVAMPDAYLNEHERFSLAGGVGFAGDEFGVGLIGSVRFDKNWSGYGGAAFSNGEAVGKVGARVGW